MAVISSLNLLPKEYQPVEYIESTGFEHIDTGLFPNQNYGFDVKFLTKNEVNGTAGEFGCIFGGRTGSSVDELQLTTFTNTADKGILRFGKGSYNAGITKGKVLTASLRNKVFTNGEGTAIDLYPYEFTSGGTITVFALNNNGNITQRGSVQIFYLKLYNLDTLIRDFIPCYRRSDNVAGLYDLVERKFYTNNSGAGEFLKGEIKSHITKYNNGTIKNINLNGVDYHFAKANEVTNGICEDAVNEPIRDMQLSGNSVQDKYGTINIFNPTLITAVKSSPALTNPYGTTINSTSYNGNSITVTQTVYSDDVSYEGYYGNGVFYIDFDKEDVLAGETYTLIADIDITNNLGNKEVIKIIPQGGALKNIPMVDGKIIVPFIQADADRNLVEIRCNGMSFVLSNIMLLKGEVTEAPDYVPVTTTPMPSYPIEIESVGDKSPNLFNVFNAIQQSNYVDRVKLNEDGSLTIYQPTGSSVSDYTTLKEFAPSLEVGKTYVLNFETTGTITASNQIWILDSKQTWKRGTSRTIIETDLNSPIFWYGDGAGKTITISQIQITEGTDTKEFEPYGYKIPVKASGKNILNPNFFLDDVLTGMYSVENNKLIVNRANTMGWATLNNLSLEPNTQYCLSLENETDIDIRTPDNVKLSNRATTTMVTFTTDSTGLVCFKFFSNDGTTYPYEIGYIQLEQGNIATKFEPYKEPITTNIYLDEPLRKIGDYADYIDYKNKKVVRNIAREFVTNIGYISTNSGAYKTFLSDISQKPLITYNSGNNIPPYSSGYAISNKFSQSIYEYRFLGNYANFIQPYITQANINRIAFTFDNSSITTIEQAQEVIGDGFEVCYVLAKPTEETIELPKIETFDGTNIFDVQTTVESSEIKISYWKQI